MGNLLQLLRLLAPALAIALLIAPADADSRKKLVMLIADSQEEARETRAGPYGTAETLPAFAAEHLESDFRVVYVFGPKETGNSSLPGIETLQDADVLLVSVRRRFPPPGDLEVIRNYLQSGGSVVGIRTANHPFAIGRASVVLDGQADWPDWDAEVLGGNYSYHHGGGVTTTVTAASNRHPILRGVTLPILTTAPLYIVSPLREGATPLLTGRIEGQRPEPVAWTFTHFGGGKSFYTSLGAAADFSNPGFQRLLANAIRWAAE